MMPARKSYFHRDSYVSLMVFTTNLSSKSSESSALKKNSSNHYRNHKYYNQVPEYKQKQM